MNEGIRESFGVAWATGPLARKVTQPPSTLKRTGREPPGPALGRSVRVGGNPSQRKQLWQIGE